MIKKLVLGIAICCGISGANGMEKCSMGFKRVCENEHDLNESRFFLKFSCFLGTLSSCDYSGWSYFFENMEATTSRWRSSTDVYGAISDFFRWGTKEILKFENDKKLTESDTIAIRRFLSIIPDVIAEMHCFDVLDPIVILNNGLTKTKQEHLMESFKKMDLVNGNLDLLLNEKSFTEAAKCAAAMRIYLLQESGIY